MSIMVKKLYKNGSMLYNMNLVAGADGLNNMVKWVHIIEDDSVIDFLHGNELVFTAGILNKQAGWLVEFARRLVSVQASAFVINLGPHTHQLPTELIEYCDAQALPLFTIPWETRMVDMTRDFCHQIMNNEHKEDTLSATIKNIIFNIGNMESQILQLERHGYKRESLFCFVCVHTVAEGEEKSAIRMIAEKTAKKLHELYISFAYKDYLVCVLVDYTDEEVRSFVQSLTRALPPVYQASIGISSNQPDIHDLTRDFEKAISAVEMSTKLKAPFCYYDKMGIYKVLYAVAEKNILKSFYEESIGKLERYDAGNETELLHLLRTYFEHNGSLQEVSEELYIHRNTVTNQLKKIEHIVGYSPLVLEDRLNLYIGLCIKDIL